jgi:hypothetical protein
MDSPTARLGSEHVAFLHLVCFRVPGSDAPWPSPVMTSTGSPIFALCLQLLVTDMQIPSRLLSATPEQAWSWDSDFETQWLEFPGNCCISPTNPDVRNLFQSNKNRFLMSLPSLPGLSPHPNKQGMPEPLGPVASSHVQTCLGLARARQHAGALHVISHQSSWVQPVLWTLPCFAYV